MVRAESAAIDYVPLKQAVAKMKTVPPNSNGIVTSARTGNLVGDDRLLKKAHLLRCPARRSLRRTASTPGPSRALVPPGCGRPPCIWTFLSSLGTCEFFGILLERRFCESSEGDYGGRRPNVKRATRGRRRRGPSSNGSGLAILLEGSRLTPYELPTSEREAVYRETQFLMKTRTLEREIERLKRIQAEFVRGFKGLHRGWGPGGHGVWLGAFQVRTIHTTASRAPSAQSWLGPALPR